MLYDNVSGLVRVLVVGTLAYISLVTLLRISGKRTLAQLNAFDFIVTVALGSTLATIALSSTVAWAEGALTLALLAALQFVVAWLAVRFAWVRRALTSEPTLLVRDGQLIPTALAQERISEQSLHQAIRSARRRQSRHDLGSRGRDQRHPERHHPGPARQRLGTRRRRRVAGRPLSTSPGRRGPVPGAEAISRARCGTPAARRPRRWPRRSPMPAASSPVRTSRVIASFTSRTPRCSTRKRSDSSSQLSVIRQYTAGARLASDEGVAGLHRPSACLGSRVVDDVRARAAASSTDSASARSAVGRRSAARSPPRGRGSRGCSCRPAR